jgi:hypothetical protein
MEKNYCFKKPPDSYGIIIMHSIPYESHHELKPRFILPLKSRMKLHSISPYPLLPFLQKSICFVSCAPSRLYLLQNSYILKLCRSLQCITSQSYVFLFSRFENSTIQRGHESNTMLVWEAGVPLESKKTHHTHFFLQLQLI